MNKILIIFIIILVILIILLPMIIYEYCIISKLRKVYPYRFGDFVIREVYPYRFGDFVKGYIYKNQKKKFLIYCKIYKNTLALKYYNEVKNLPDDKKWNNLDILNKLTKSNKKLDVVLHLRLGDVIGDYNKEKNIFEQRAGNKKYTYFYQPNVYINIVKELKKLNIKKVNVFYGSHTDDFDENNKLYVKKIKNIFESNNIEFIESLSNNADEDFILMSNSKIFIKSGGGYSRIIKNLVLKRGNIIIDPGNI